jgi:hypothetical protein
MKTMRMIGLLFLALGMLCVLGLLGCEDPTEITYALRDTGPAGGLIFYENPDYETDGWRYLEAAPADCDGGALIAWWTAENLSSGAYYQAIGTGNTNTNLILSAQGAGSPGYAADACDSMTAGGYSDWFLPSIGELIEMRTQLKELGSGGFADSDYWSSSAMSMAISLKLLFSDSSAQQSAGNTGTYKVRAVRAF